MGVPLRQLYGQTETLGAYTLHRGETVDFDTVGVPFDDSIEIRVLDPDRNGIGEVLARHANMFHGYYKADANTPSDVRDGWMHTGTPATSTRRANWSSSTGSRTSPSTSTASASRRNTSRTS